MKGKAILAVSFGTTYPETLKLTIESVESKIKQSFPEFEVRRAFTSRMVIKRIFERDGIRIDTEIEALDRLRIEGYQEVYIQPLHIVAGEEYEKIERVVSQYSSVKAFRRLALGRPILFYGGEEGKPDDYLIAINAIRNLFPALSAGEAAVLMGHGGLHPANAAYGALQVKLADAGLENVFVYTVEGFPSLAEVIKKLKTDNIKKVVLIPFMLVAGAHVMNDMIGDDKDSARSQVVSAGIEVRAYLQGMGENAAIQDIYIQHLKDIIDED